MPKRRLILRFLVRLGLICAILLALWPLIRTAYGTAFRGGMHAIYGNLGTNGFARFEPIPMDNGTDDTRIVVGVPDSPASPWSTTLSSKNIAYSSTLLFAGLVLASPVSWSRRVRGLILGLLILHSVVVARVGIVVFYEWSLHNPGALGLRDGFWGNVLRAGIGWISNGHMLTYVVPILLWILVTFRRSEWDKLFRSNRNSLNKRVNVNSVGAFHGKLSGPE